MTVVEELTPGGALYRRLRLQSLEPPDPGLVSQLVSTPAPGGHDAIRGDVRARRIVDERSGATEEFARMNGELVRLAGDSRPAGDRWLRVVGWVLGVGALVGLWLLRRRPRVA
jgi:hypothetical protein